MPDSPRKRSRSPRDDEKRHRDRDVKRHRSRSRSPRRSAHRHHHHHHQNKDGHHHHRQHRSRGDERKEPPAVRLPFNCQTLDKYDYEDFRALFTGYLDLQKGIDIAELNETEVKGRWKSFVGKWNRKELADGWYDPGMKQRAEERFAEWPEEREEGRQEKEVRREDRPVRTTERVNPHPLPPLPVEADEEEEDDDGYGPALPSAAQGGRRVGPAVPSLQDLEQKRETSRDDQGAQRADLRYERKEDRKAQKERLDDLAPRAEPGSRERQLEKKRETADANRSFREAKSPGAEEVGEKDLMGEDGIEGYKAQVKAKEKVKSERELRKEEVLRAKIAEREERLAEYRKKEEKTMEMLKGLAKQRYG